MISPIAHIAAVANDAIRMSAVELELTIQNDHGRAHAAS